MSKSQFFVYMSPGEKLKHYTKSYQSALSDQGHVLPLIHKREIIKNVRDFASFLSDVLVYISPNIHNYKRKYSNFRVLSNFLKAHH